MDQNTVASVLFAFVAILVGADLAADAGSGASWGHLGSEGLATAVALIGAAWFFRRSIAQRQEMESWRARAEELLAGVGTTVHAQFETWSLTGAEAEVALLLLKGLSFKEIAAVRSTADRTAREQARTVYKKAGVAGRAELSAWFIEDML